ncbi:MAG: hypothetical protein AB1775_06260 [Bacteroidota bacterium]
MKELNISQMEVIGGGLDIWCGVSVALYGARIGGLLGGLGGMTAGAIIGGIVGAFAC